MKKFRRTLSRTIETMISPPTASPSASVMALATRRMMTRGLDQKAEETDQPCKARLPHKAVGTIETYSSGRLIGSQTGRCCLQQFQQIPQRSVPRAV
jgi:hypothetical protein